MDADSYLDHLQGDGARLVAAGRSAPDANVPSCPEWDLTELVKHVGGAHRWVESMVSARSSEMLPFPKRPRGWSEVAAWYEGGLELLVRALREAGPEVLVWNWMANGAGPALFWFRRMAHETSIHRWDAENAVGDPRPIGAELAVDGVDEAIAMLAMRLSMQPEPALSGSIGIEATDADFSRTLRLTPGTLEQVDGIADTGMAVRGTASDIQLWLTGRSASSASSISVEGDRAIADALGAIKFG